MKRINYQKSYHKMIQEINILYQELLNNSIVNAQKGFENTVDIDYIIERLNYIKELYYNECDPKKN